jgi:hypothetical protein
MENPAVAWVRPVLGGPVGLVPFPSVDVTSGPSSLPRLDAWLARVVSETGVLVVLLTDDELRLRAAEDLVNRGLVQQLTVLRRPLARSLHVPDWLMNEIAHLGRDGVVFACSSGRGRSATAAAWSLMLNGLPSAESIDLIRGAVGPLALRDALSASKIGDFARLLSKPESKTDRGLIPSKSLRRSHLPPPNAPWNFLSGFAQTFDGYAVGRYPTEVEAALWQRRTDYLRTGTLNPGLTLDDSRVSLLQNFMQWHWEGGEPDADHYLFAWGLVEHMRQLVQRP